MSFEEVLRSHQRVNDLSRSLIGRPAFDELHVAIPDPASPEPGFIRATSWLYCLYFEAGRVSLKFLRGVGEVYGVLEKAACEQHVAAVRSLRTELHHNLGFSSSDQSARTAAEAWRRAACGTVMPRDNEQWRKCYEQLVSDASHFLGQMDEVVRRMEADGTEGNAYAVEWRRRLERSWSAADFDRLIEDAKYRFGRDAMETVSFRSRHLDRWRQQLDLLKDGFDFDSEATRLIEKTLLDEDSLVLPITGRDIIDRLQIQQGPKVGELLQASRARFESNPCTQEELLEYIAELEGFAPTV